MYFHYRYQYWGHWIGGDAYVFPRGHRYDKRARTYACGARFKPIFLKPDTDHDLSRLRSISDGILTQEEPWISQLPAFDTVRGPARGIDVGKLRTVFPAILNRQAIAVEFDLCMRRTVITTSGAAIKGSRRAPCKISQICASSQRRWRGTGYRTSRTPFQQPI